jgi:hypothetical protein
MDFSPFIFIALLIAFSGIRIVGAIIRDRHTIFDDDFTDLERGLVRQAAYFILVPVSVALHEVGHAVMVWVFGGAVLDFNFYVFAGSVAFEGFFTETELILIAVAGTVVNVALAALAFGLVLLRRPPMRAAFNELLVQFATLSLANALIFYPVLDLITGISGGDFRQMYDGGVPWLSAIIFACHLGILAGGAIAFRSRRFSAHIGALVGLPPYVRRGFLGGLQVDPRAAAMAAFPQNAEAETLVQAAFRRVAQGWTTPIHLQLLRRPEGPTVLAIWRRADGDRTVILRWEPAGSVAIILPPRGARSLQQALAGSVWKRWAELTSEDDLVIGLRVAMEAADEREPTLFAASLAAEPAQR